MKKCNFLPLTLQLSDILDDNKFIIPQFQRSVVWKQKRRKDFITNLRNGEPFGVIPIRMNNNRYELIDGLQRITTIRDYINRPFEYLTENDLNIDLIKQILRSHLKDLDVAVDENYIATRTPELKSYLFDCIKGNLKEWEIIEQTKSKFGFKSHEISEYISQIREEFKNEQDISTLTVMAIDYRGPSENIPTVFYNLNTGGVQLSKYETYAALWSTPLYQISDTTLLTSVKNKYTQLQEDSDIDVDFDEDDLITNGITLFEYCYALGEVIRNRDNKFDLLFGENTKSTDPVGFEILALILGLGVNKAEKLHDLLKDAPSSFLIDIKDMIEQSLKDIKSALSNVVYGLNKSGLTSDSNYLMYHILISYIKQYYTVDLHAWKVIPKNDTLPIKDFKKYLHLHYIFDCLTDYWRINRQVSDLQRELSDEQKTEKYWHNIALSDWKEGIDDFISSQSNVAKNIPQKNKLFINFLMFLKLKETPMFSIHFMNPTDDQGILDFEHIIPKKIIQNHLKDMKASEQSIFPVSTIGNLCYLSVKDNRSKRDKTIYEFKESRPSYTFDSDYLDFIEYPSEEELYFIHYSNTKFRDAYIQFLKNRTDKLCSEFLRLIKKFYF